MEQLELLASSLGTVITLISIVIAVVQKQFFQQKFCKKLSWKKIEIGVDYIFEQLKIQNFQPDVIMALSERGVAVVVKKFNEQAYQIPIMVSFWKNNAEKDTPNYIELHSRGRHFYMPSAIFGYIGCKILVIDDWSYTGASMRSVLSELLRAGCKKEDVKLCTICSTHAAKEELGILSRYIKDSNSFCFPWGHAS